MWMISVMDVRHPKSIQCIPNKFTIIPHVIDVWWRRENCQTTLKIVGNIQYEKQSKMHSWCTILLCNSPCPGNVTIHPAGHPTQYRTDPSPYCDFPKLISTFQSTHIPTFQTLDPSTPSSDMSRSETPDYHQKPAHLFRFSPFSFL